MKLKLFPLLFLVCTSLSLIGQSSFKNFTVKTDAEQIISKALSAIKESKASSATQLDSMYNWEWNNNVWEAIDKYLYYYNANHNLATAYQFEWNGTSWDIDDAYNYTYDTQNNVIGIIAQYWDGASWIDNVVDTLVYDANSNLVSHTIAQLFMGTWQNQTRLLYTYDNNNNCLTYLRETLNSGVWVGNELHTYTYDANNNKMSDTWEQNMSGTWTVFHLDLYSYNTANLMLTDTIFNQMGYQELFNYSYDVNNNLTTEFLQEWWSTGPWDDYMQFVNSYDANNNRINRTIQFIGPGGPVSVAQYIWDYNASNNQIAELYQLNIGVNSDSVHYYYGTPSGISESDKPSVAFTVTPNPAKDYIVIKLNDEWSIGNASIRILNTLAQEILNEPFKNNTERIYCGKFKPGLYYVHLYDGLNYSCTKLVIE